MAPKPEVSTSSDVADPLSAFHLDHYRGASRLQRWVDRVTALIGRPLALVIVAAGLGLWAGLILIAGPDGRDSFAWLELAATCGALLVAILVLVTQRREDLLAERRGQLILELAVLADKKGAKIIALLEEMRRDAPDLSDRIDVESADMATPTVVEDVIAAIDLRAEEI